MTKLELVNAIMSENGKKQLSPKQIEYNKILAEKSKKDYLELRYNNMLNKLKVNA